MPIKTYLEIVIHGLKKTTLNKRNYKFTSILLNLNKTNIAHFPTIH